MKQIYICVLFLLLGVNVVAQNSYKKQIKEDIKIKLHLTQTSHINTKSDGRKADSLQLVNIYNSLNGSNWKNKSGWLKDSLNKWYGVSLNSNGRVIKIDLHDNNLKGDFPFIYDMSTSVFTDLEYFDVSSNEIEGLYIWWLFALTKSSIVYFDISDNKFSLNLIFDSKFSKLKLLDISGNDINDPSGYINSYLQLPTLEYLDISSNPRIETAVTELQNASALILFDASSCNIKSLSTDSVNCKKLQYFGFAANRVSKDLLSWLINFQDLYYIDVSYTGGSGNIPAEIKNLPLKYFNIGGNNYQGEFLPEFYQMTSLTHLNIYDNPITGVIGSDIKNLTNLEILNVSNTQMSGELPEELYSLTSLKQLWLANCKFTGELSENLGNLTNLEYLIINNNQFYGYIPDAIGNLTNIKHLNISHNQFSGQIPDISNLTRLEDFDISYNFLHGAIDSYFNNFTNLRYINISNNLFTDIYKINIQNLKRLIINNNNFDFADMDSVKDMQANLDLFKYTPQSYFKAEEQLSGKNLTLTFNIKGNNISYKWYNLDEPLSENTNSITVDTTIQGAFYCMATSSDYPDLTLKTIAVNTSGNLTKYGILTQEYNALSALYDEANGYNWNDKTLWLSDTIVNAWYGVKVNSVHVTGLFLSGNNLSGKITESIKELKYLEKLSFEHNRLESLPDLSALTNLSYLNISANNLVSLPELPNSLTELHVEGNSLTFGDLETVADKFGNITFTYSPQRKFFKYAIHSPVVGEKYTVEMQIDGDFNKFSWYKNDTAININTKNLVFENFQLKDTGVYYCRVKNTKLPDLELQSKDQIVIKAFKVFFHIIDNNGNPVDSVNIKLEGYGDTLTNKNGEITFLHVKNADRLDYTITKPGFKTIRDYIKVEDANVEINDTVQPVVITFLVRDLAGNPINNASIVIRDNDTVYTDSLGIYRLYKAIPGFMLYTIHKDYHIDVSDTLKITEEDDTLFITLKFVDFTQFQVIPNPNQGIFHIFTTVPIENVSINIYNRDGILFFSEKFAKLKNELIKLPQIPSGIYYIYITNEKIRRTVKFIKIE